MAAYTPARLYQGQPGTSSATLYTVPSSTTVIVKQILVANTTSTAATLTLSLVPSGGTAGVTHHIASAVTVQGNALVTFDLAQVMTAADFLAGLQGTSGALTVTISGLTIA